MVYVVIGMLIAVVLIQTSHIKMLRKHRDILRDTITTLRAGKEIETDIIEAIVIEEPIQDTEYEEVFGSGPATDTVVLKGKLLQ